MKSLIWIFVFLTLTSVSLAQQCENGTTKPCNLLGVCSTGINTCINGFWSACDVTPTEEVCNDNLDNDCDGVLDENCLCTEGETSSCGSDLGICKGATKTCLNGTWTDCSIKPSMELFNITQSCSNQLDDDCDGKADSIDEGCTNPDHCRDRQRNYNEVGIDCGGSCERPCNWHCSNGFRDVDETGQDCGGEFCEPCQSCNDGIQNQGETGIDCGGPCYACDTGTPAIDTDLFVCGDNACEEELGENELNCSDDCKNGSLKWIIILFIIIILLLILFLLLKKRSAKKKKPQQILRIHPMFLKESAKKSESDLMAEKLRKIK